MDQVPALVKWKKYGFRRILGTKFSPMKDLEKENYFTKKLLEAMAVKKIATNSHFQTATYSKGLPFPSPSIMKGCPFTAPSIQSLIFMSGLIALCEKKVEWIPDLWIYKPEENIFFCATLTMTVDLK